MEHIVQFAIGIDDDAIVKRVSANAEKEIIKQLKTEVADKVFGPRYSYGNTTDPNKIFTPFVRDIIGEFLEKNRDVILDNASKMLVERLARSKKGKEILNNL